MARNKFLANVEWLAVRVGVEITYDPKEEWFVVKTGDGGTFSNVDLYESLLTIMCVRNWIIPS